VENNVENSHAASPALWKTMWKTLMPLRQLVRERDRVAEALPGPETVILVVKRPARPHKSARERRFTVENSDRLKSGRLNAPGLSVCPGLKARWVLGMGVSRQTCVRATWTMPMKEVRKSCPGRNSAETVRAHAKVPEREDLLWKTQAA
jgi:hypothetical protein